MTGFATLGSSRARLARSEVRSLGDRPPAVACQGERASTMIGPSLAPPVFRRLARAARPICNIFNPEPPP